MNIAGPAAKGLVGGAVGGYAGGYAGGFTGGLVATGDLSLAHKQGMDGVGMGTVIGSLSGMAGGMKYARDNNMGAWSGGYKKSSTAVNEITNLIPEGKLANHLFKGTDKLVDNPANRTLIQNISNGKPLVVDIFGKSWYRGVDAAGNGIYTYTQNGIVKGAGYTNLSAAELIFKYTPK